MNMSARFFQMNPSLKTFSLGVAAAIFMTTAATAGSEGGTASPDPTGFWQSSGGDQIVKVEPCRAKSAKLCGTIVWAQDASAVDSVILKRFRQVGDVWAGGQIYAPGKRRGEDGRLNLLSDTQLEVSECKRGLCHNTVWERVEASDVASRRAQLMAEN